MSGGMRSGPARREGDHPSCTKRRGGRTGTPADAHPIRGVQVLTAGGRHAPSSRRESTSAVNGWQVVFPRKGSKPEGGDWPVRLRLREPGPARGASHESLLRKPQHLVYFGERSILFSAGERAANKMIRFEIGGRRVRPENIGDAIMQAVLKSLTAQIREQIGSIRDPETGEFPTVVMRGDSLDNLKMHVEGSEKVVQLVRERLGMEEDGEKEKDANQLGTPQAFLSYASEDAELAERVARALQASGIETWWDRWCIGPGDSLRQKIDEGLGGCTHFLVLLTLRSIKKPWVNQEMDAGLVRRLRDQCRFLPVRYELSASELPPLLSGMHAPEISADEDITQLVNDIHGISRKPALGPSPHAQAKEASTQTGYSPAANTVARYFVENTKYGRFGDPMIDVEPLAEATGLTLDDTKDALFELSPFFKDTKFHALVKGSLFTEFDRHWKPWNPREDALKLAADIMNDEGFPGNAKAIAELYGWEPRRLNPAATFLFERNLLVDYKVMGNPEFEFHRIVGKPDEIRRFLKGRN